MKTNRLPRVAAALAAIAICSADASRALAQGRCLTPPEKSAFEFRMLMTELMVAALTCRGVGGQDFSAPYAAFVERHRAATQSHATVFKEHFRRVHGGAATTQMDRYVTSLANEYSRASMSGTGTFCTQQGPLFERASTVSSADVDRFAAERAASHPIGIPTCGEQKPAPQKAQPQAQNQGQPPRK